MARTVIDEILVKLGLDTRDFTKGEKEVAASVLRTKKVVVDASKEMSQGSTDAINQISGGLGSLIKRAAVIAIVLKALKFISKEVLEASRATRQLGNDSRNYDIAAARLRNFQNVAEMFGGSAEDATKTIAGLQKSIFNLSFNGQISDQLVMLGRLGVQFQSATGHAREFKDVFLDSAEALHQNIANGTMTEGEAFQYATQAGFDPGLARAALGGRESAQAALDRQEQRRQVSGEDVKAATANEQAITSLGQAYEAGKVAASTKASGLITNAAGGMEHVVNAASGQESLEQVWGAWTAAVAPATMALGDFTDAVRGTSESLAGLMHNRGTGRAGYEGIIQAAAAKNGLDPQILAGLLNTESGFNPNAVSPAGAVGIAQFMPGTAQARGFTAGKDPFKDIMESARYLAELRQHFEKSGSSPDEAMDLALMSYNAGERRVRTSSFMQDGGKPLSGETTGYPGKIYEYAEQSRADGAAGGTTTVDVGEVNVYTQSKDPEGMADGAAGALKRKLSAAHAEQGMQ